MVKKCTKSNNTRHTFIDTGTILNALFNVSLGLGSVLKSNPFRDFSSDYSLGFFLTLVFRKEIFVGIFSYNIQNKMLNIIQLRNKYFSAFSKRTGRCSV